MALPLITSGLVMSACAGVLTDGRAARLEPEPESRRFGGGLSGRAAGLRGSSCYRLLSWLAGLAVDDRDQPAQNRMDSHAL